MYTIFERRGVVIRNSDGAVVAPTNDTESQDFIDWVSWCSAGNSPTLGTEPEQGARFITKLDFRRRFTLTERVTVDSSSDPMVRTLLTDLAMAEGINLDDEDVIDGLAYLEAHGLIAQGRAAEIRA